MEELGSGAFAAVRYVGETGSTNADAAELLGDPRFAGLTIVAEYQTRGSGRKGRSWLAQPGTALLFTTILPRPIDSDRLWTVPFWTALAVGRALDVCGVAAALQWPNDLLIDDRKVAGILCTSRVTGRNAHVGCGVGINVHRRAGAQAGIEPPPAFCDDRNPSIVRATLLRAILAEFDATLDALDDAERVARAWESAAGLPGKRYRLLEDGASTSFEATALGLDRGGGLIVARETGERETIALADARVLR